MKNVQREQTRRDVRAIRRMMRKTRENVYVPPVTEDECRKFSASGAIVEYCANHGGKR